MIDPPGAQVYTGVVRAIAAAVPDASHECCRGAALGRPLHPRTGAPTPELVAMLQRTAGNRVVARLVAGRGSVGEDRPRRFRLARSERHADGACCDECAQGLPCASDSAERRNGLTSPRFLAADDTPEPTLEACYEDRARLAMGARGEPVEMVQQALIDLGYDLGDRGADGDFGPKTAGAVKDFKADEQLGFEWIGDVGPRTMNRLDELFPPDLPVCPVVPVPDVVVATADVAPAVPAEVTVGVLARDPRPARPRSEREQRCNPRRHRDQPLPPGSCPPAPSTPGVCGPDVTAEVKRAWTKARSDFFKLPLTQQDENCDMLVNPVVTDPTTGKLTLNADAFDTWGLFQGSAHWTRIPPWHGPCGTPGTTSTDNCDEFDPLHECDTVCSNTVQIGDECWLSGTVNYGLFGVLMKSCFDHYTLLALVSPLAGLKIPLFSLASTMSLVGAYKALKGDNIVGPERWAAKTWLLGPGAVATGGNRPNCAPTCTGPAPPTFLVVWEPNMPRGGMPAVPPYMCAPSP